MKKFLSKVSVGLLVAFTVCALCLFAGCKKGSADGKVLFAEQGTLVLTVTEASEGATLEDVMEKMQADGKLTFAQEGGMLTGINGYTPATGEYWFIYTSCADYANTAYGEYEYEGTKYGSSTLGYQELPAVEGAIYIFNASVWRV